MRLDKYLADNLPPNPTLEQIAAHARDWADDWPPVPAVEAYHGTGGELRVRVKFPDCSVYANTPG